MLVVVAVAAVLALIGGSFAYATLHKTVTLSIDGKAKEVGTFDGTVADVLSSQGIHLTSHDAVAPSPQTSIEEGSRIAVRFGRQLTLRVDGEAKQYWVTATTVDQALDQIGARYRGADLSTSRGSYIGRDGLRLAVATPKKFTLVTAGKPRRVVTTGLTVGQALADLDIGVDRNDEATPVTRTRISDGSRIVLVPIDPGRSASARCRSRSTRSRGRARRCTPTSRGPPGRGATVWPGQDAGHVRRREGPSPRPAGQGHRARTGLEVTYVGTKARPTATAPSVSGSTVLGLARAVRVRR